MNRKINIILIIIIGLFLSALIFKNGDLLLLSFPFISYLITGFFTTPKNINLQITRNIEHYRVEENEPNKMQITIKNNGSDLPSLYVIESVLPGLTLLSGNVNQVFAMKKDQSVELEYRFTAKRGHYYWNETKIFAGDLFKLAPIEVNLTEKVDSIVIPKKILLPKICLKPRYKLQAPGINLSNKPGSGVDFWGVREYTAGDSLGHIHWRVSAHYQNKYFIKQFEQENMADVGILIDASRPNGSTSNGNSLVDYCVNAGAAISRNLLKSGNRVSLLVFGKNRTRVFPGTGKYQLQKILDTLAECEPGDTSAQEIIKFIPVRLFASHTTIILISPLQQNDPAIITKLKAEGYQVILISPNLLPSLLANERAEPSLFLRAVLLEREIMLWKIRQMGVKTINWSVEEPLSGHFLLAR